MSLKHGLLGLLNYGKMTGYELDKTFKESLSFFWRGQTSQIYRELSAMEKAGWLSSEIIYQTGKPNKKLYCITKKGKAELTNWLGSAADKVVEEMLHVRSAFLMRLFFAGEIPVKKTADMIRFYRDKCREIIAEMRNVPAIINSHTDKSERSDFWHLTARYGDSFYAMSEKWAAEVLAVLEKQSNAKTKKGGKK
jgi:DNA-binding PadR family transcriptional regulator